MVKLPFHNKLLNRLWQIEHAKNLVNSTLAVNLANSQFKFRLGLIPIYQECPKTISSQMSLHIF